MQGSGEIVAGGGGAHHVLEGRGGGLGGSRLTGHKAQAVRRGSRRSGQIPHSPER